MADVRKNRMVKFISGAAAALAVIGGVVVAAPSVPQPPLALVADVPLGGNTTRFDYESLDSQRHLLFIAHLGDSAVIAFDTRARRVVARIAGVSKVHGVLVVPELNRVYASATGTNEVVAIDETTFKIRARMPGGVYPDGMAYAPEVHKLYVSDEHGATDTVIDVSSNTRVGTIQLGGDIGNTQYDEGSKHIFVNAQTRRQLIEIDPMTDKIVARIDLPGAEGNHGLLIEPKRRRAFIACESNDKLLVLDLESKKVLAAFDVGKDPDVLAYDPGPGLLYVAGEAGVLSLFKTDDAQVSKAGEGMLGPNAHTVAVDPDTHLSYFPLKDLDGKTILRIMKSDAAGRAQ
ncbi:MAG TPA: YncE family protein [Steroidobacteraceae bacterium]|nr:YncE family protein [Steroidobacteraceae bacterium]